MSFHLVQISSEALVSVTVSNRSAEIENVLKLVLLYKVPHDGSLPLVVVGYEVDEICPFRCHFFK